MRFEPFAIDTRRWRLLRSGHAIDLSPRLVEILAYLAKRQGEVVSKDELLDRFWVDVHVTDNTLTRAVADIRKALGDQPDPPQFIQTVSRRGYRFIAPVDQSLDPAPAVLVSARSSDLGEQRRDARTRGISISTGRAAARCSSCTSSSEGSTKLATGSCSSRTASRSCALAHGPRAGGACRPHDSSAFFRSLFRTCSPTPHTLFDAARTPLRRVMRWARF